MNLLQLIRACRCTPALELVDDRMQLVTDSSPCPVHRWIGRPWGRRDL